MCHVYRSPAASERKETTQTVMEITTYRVLSSEWASFKSKSSYEEDVK